MKFIKPVVGISKITDNFDSIICGYNGVLSKGDNINAEALNALSKCILSGKEVIILSNSYKRVKDIADMIKETDAQVLQSLKSIITAGEILHYKLKHPQSLGISGKRYYNLGSKDANNIFDGLDYQEVSDISQADFIFMGAVKNQEDVIENYVSELEYAVSVGMAFLCVGNDTATYKNGEICIGAGAVAEQYALLGGKVITIGKPDTKVLHYATESLTHKDKILIIGDSFTTDIKSSKFVNAETVLISKGIHVNFLGEGYIPDVQKARDMAQDYEVYPDYIMSGLRW